jgi:catechol 2,3-dioxygenase-like lactoylglutathione lyase family enzyme
MGTLGISHVAVGVSDMDRALAFYRDLIGLRVTLDTTERIESRSGKGNRRRAVYLRANEGPHEFFIVLDQQLDREPFGTPPRLFQLGTHHFSFWVDDLEDKVLAAGQAGFEVFVIPTRSTPAAYGEAGDAQRVMTTILRDGDGNLVQLDQRLPAEVA